MRIEMFEPETRVKLRLDGICSLNSIATRSDLGALEKSISDGVTSIFLAVTP